MSGINAVTGVTGVATTPQRPSAPKAADRPAAQATAAAAANLSSASTKTPAKQPVPIRYFGGIDGMNAANLIVALQANGAVSGGYSAQAIETGGTPPPTIVEKDA